MNVSDIAPKTTYTNGKDSRHVVGFGATHEWVVWGNARDRLPLGGFVTTRCTSTKSFAKWATAVVKKD